MAPPRKLPGLYYDPEKKKYFSEKDPITGISRKRRSSPAPAAHPINRKARRAIELLRARALNGNMIMYNKRSSFFEDECQKMQFSQPTIWLYHKRENAAETALEQLHGILQTPNGLRECKLLLGGNMGCMRSYAIDHIMEDSRTECSPEPVWPLSAAQSKSAVHSIWCGNDIVLPSQHLMIPSSISSIRRFPQSQDAVNANGQSALVTTLEGSAFIAKLNSEAVDVYLSRVASWKSTVWTSDCNLNGTRAAIGTDSGSSLLDLETRARSWIFNSRSAVFCQKFVGVGNIVLCGLRSGAVIPVDTRQQRQLQQYRMPSSVCSLVSLQSDEKYFLGSSFDGSILLFDCRALQKGAVQSYAGHVNSHTHLQLAVNPPETLVISGGQDKAVRIWSIKDGECIFAENVRGSTYKAFCWPQSDDNFSRGSGLWMGSRDDLCYLQGT